MKWHLKRYCSRGDEWPKRNEDYTMPETRPTVQIKLGLPWHVPLVADLRRPVGAYRLQHVLTHVDAENTPAESQSETRRLPR